MLCTICYLVSLTIRLVCCALFVFYFDYNVGLFCSISSFNLNYYVGILCTICFLISLTITLVCCALFVFLFF